MIRNSFRTCQEELELEFEAQIGGRRGRSLHIQVLNYCEADNTLSEEIIWRVPRAKGTQLCILEGS
jgi:hypothetical protein